MKEILEQYILDITQKKEKIIKSFMINFGLNIQEDLKDFVIENYPLGNTERLLYKGKVVYHTENMEPPKYGIIIYEDWTKESYDYWNKIVNE